MNRKWIVMAGVALAGATLLQGCGAGDPDPLAVHFFSPKITLSTTSHKQWTTSRCTSCTRIVR